MAKAAETREKPEHAARHCLTEIPYRMLAYVRHDGNNTPLFQVAGVPDGPMGAEKALKLAYAKHGGDCFYCRKPIKKGEFTLDHAVPRAAGGTIALQNLLISCRPCNLEKGSKPIELYKKDPGREWLAAQLAQIQERLNRL